MNTLEIAETVDGIKFQLSFQASERDLKNLFANSLGDDAVQIISELQAESAKALPPALAEAKRVFLGNLSLSLSQILMERVALFSSSDSP